MSARYPSRAELEHRKHSVYVLWCDDLPVYVGMTSDWQTRMSSHGMFSDYPHWNPAVTHADVWLLGCNRTEAERVELDTIAALLPLRNSRGIPYEEPGPITVDTRPIHERDPERWASMVRAINAIPVPARAS